MEVIVNGERVDIDVITIEEVVNYYGLEKHLVVTEIDGEIIDCENWRITQLVPGMKIEIVQFVGGG